MAQRWTPTEEQNKFKKLQQLYVKENKTIGEIGSILGLAQSTVFQWIKRLGIPSTPERKETCIAQKRRDITIPKRYSNKLAEFFGIMLGDGNLSYYQVVVTLGTKELAYAEYIVDLINNLFGARPKIGFRKNNFKDVYLGCVDLTEWLRKEGLVYNKVASQVGAPRWVLSKKEYMENFLRGFFDTDGSVYRLRFGVQIAFNNKSEPLLQATHRMLKLLTYHPSKIAGPKIYLTKRNEVVRFFQEIKPANPKHEERFKNFINMGR